MMGSLLGNWPSHDPHNFSQIQPSDPSNPSKFTPTTYHATHGRALPPKDQVISNETGNILLRHFYKSTEKKLRSKRGASDSLIPDHTCKQQRNSSADGSE